MGDHQVLKDQDLLLLALVSDVAELIDASSVVASPCPVVHTSRNESDAHFFALESACCLAEVALNKRREPLDIDVLCNKIPVKFEVPKVPTVRSNHFYRVFATFLHPCDASLSRRCQIVPVREIKPITQELLNRFHYLILLLVFCLDYRGPLYTNVTTRERQAYNKGQNFYTCNFHNFGFIDSANLLRVADHR